MEGREKCSYNFSVRAMTPLLKTFAAHKFIPPTPLAFFTFQTKLTFPQNSFAFSNLSKHYAEKNPNLS